LMQVSLSPPNSLILILDPDTNDLSDIVRGALVSATPSCVAVGTLCEIDGETTIVLADNETELELDSSMHQEFDGTIVTQSHMISVCTVTRKTLLSFPVEARQIHIQIWANHRSEPNRICILAGDTA
jgi:hypothetical protein